MSNYLVQNKLSKDELERVENRLRNVLLPNPTVQQINEYDFNYGRQANEVMKVAYPAESIELSVAQGLNLQRKVGRLNYKLLNSNSKYYVSFCEGKTTLTHVINFNEPNSNTNPIKQKQLYSPTKKPNFGSLTKPVKRTIPLPTVVRSMMKEVRVEGQPHLIAEYNNAMSQLSDGHINLEIIVLLWDVYLPTPRLHISRFTPKHNEIRPDMFDMNGEAIIEHGLRFVQPPSRPHLIEVYNDPKDFLKTSQSLKLPQVTFDFNEDYFDDFRVMAILNIFDQRKKLRKERIALNRKYNELLKKLPH